MGTDLMVAVVGDVVPAGSRHHRRSTTLVLVGAGSALHPLPRPLATAPGVYRRRRIAAAAVAFVFVSLLAMVLHGLVAGSGSGSLTAPDRSEAPLVYVVQPGDTFWSIARHLHPHGDPRPLVSRMVAAHGSPVLHVGERISLP